MKKFISAILASVMVLTMSISSFASVDVVFGEGPKGATNDANVEEFVFEHAKVYRDDKLLNDGYNPTNFDPDLEAGDVIYFAIHDKDGNNVTGEADKDWVVKINAANFVKSAEFVWDKDLKIGTSQPCLWVKVSLEKEFNHYKAKDSSFYFYIYDKADKSSSEKIRVYCHFAKYGEEEIDVNSIVAADTNVIYTLPEGSKSSNIVFDFEDNYLVTRMYDGEKYIIYDNSLEYNKELSIKYDVDVDMYSVETNFDYYDLVFKASKDNKQVAMVDGDELIPVAANYVKKLEVSKDEYVLVEGYVVEDAEDGEYVLLDKDFELTKAPAEPEKEDKAEPSESAKPNPSTGFNDTLYGIANAAIGLSIVGIICLVGGKEEK